MSNERVQLPTRINESEAIIDGFWDQNLSALKLYMVNKGIAGSLPAHCNPRAFQFWCWATLKWDQAPLDRPIMTFERTMNVDLRRYDRLMVRLCIPEHVSLTVDAIIDGSARRLIDGEAGRGGPHEYEAPIAGRRLLSLKLTLASQRDQADEGWLYWIGLANDARRTAMLARPNPFNACWDGWLLPAEERPGFAPRFGFFFDAADLPALRRRAASAAYRPLLEQMRARVRRAMAFHKSPEDQVGDYAAGGAVWTIQSRTRDWDTYPFYTEAPLIAFIGLIDEDPAMLRFAARCAVAAAHCRSWSPHFMQDFPGSTWDTRAFPEAHVAAGVALTLDWAGAWFTGAGEHLLRYALTHKALGRIRGTFLQYDHMWDCNQHHLIALGRLLALLVQLGQAGQNTPAGGEASPAARGLTPETRPGWARARDDIDQLERDMAEMIDRYVQEDGSTNEGIGYWGASFRCTLPALVALARYRGKPLRDMIAPKLDRMWNFIAPLLSTAGEPGTYLAIADTSSNILPWDAITMPAVSLSAPGWRNLLGACLGGGKQSMIGLEFMIDGPFSLIFGPDNPPTGSVDVPVFRRLETAGMITSNRPWRLPTDPGRAGESERLPPEVGRAGEGHTIRLHLVGAMANAGHCHPDKGSFILEACGDIFGGDRGVTPYVDPRCRTLAAEAAHNLAVPEGCFQINPSPSAALWHGEGDAHRLWAEIDASGAWKPPVRVARRRIHSRRPELIEIEDEFELDEARPVTFYFNTPLPISIDGRTAVIQGSKARLTVEAEWAAGASAGEYYCDFAYRPYNRLAITSPAATRHLLRTVLRFELV